MDFIKELSKFSSATVHEALGKTGNLPSQIKPIHPSMKVCGPAYTVKTMPADNTLLHRAYAYAKKGDILVVDCSGYYEAGYWGDLMSLGAKTKGIGGLIIDGCVRDADEIEAMGFPVFARGLCIAGTSKFGEGILNQTLILAGQKIEPGDFMLGDRDGIVVIPKDKIEYALTKAREREEKEEEVRKQLRMGKTSLEIYGWDNKFGY